MYDAINLTAQAVQQVGNDPLKIIKKLAGTRYDGICAYTNDKNNVLAQSVTIYRFDPADGSKKFIKKVEIPFVPNDELVVITTTTAPPAPAG